MSDNYIKTIIVEDDPDFVYLIEKLLHKDTAIEYAGHASNPFDALELAHTSDPDIVLMDLCLTPNELDGIETAKKIRCSTRAKILIVTSFEDNNITISSCVKSFASGYIFKSQPETLLPAIKYTAAGVTPQEQLIHSMILNQLSDAEKVVFRNMAGEDIRINSSLKTIANQKTSILKKLGLNNQNEVKHIFSLFHCR